MTTRQEKALHALLTAPTRAAAAQAAGVGVSTLRRWLREDESFRAEYKTALKELYEDASARAKQNLTQALDVLAEVMSDDEETAQARIAAARSTLEYGLKLTELVDMADRLDALEQKIEEAEKR